MWKLLVVPLVLIAAAVVTPDTSWASHYTYWQENPEERSRWDGTYSFNAVAEIWSYGPYDTKWGHDGVFPARARAAIQTWENAVPELNFVQAGTGHHLYFMKGFCDALTDACLTRIRTDPNHAHQANYMLSGQIRLTMAQPYLTDLGMEDQLRHEIGHWIGLDEQYN